MYINYHWRSRPGVEQLERDIGELRSVIIQLRREVKTKTGHLGRLKMLVQQRSDVIDDLRGRIEQLQERNRHLDAECEQLVALVRLS